MNVIVESLQMAFTSIWFNKVRTLLTTLGIIIGVGAVIGLISLGRGVEDYIKNEFQSLGANLITINTQTPEDDRIDRVEPLTIEDVNELSNHLTAPSLEQVGAVYNISGVVLAEGTGLRSSVRGVTANMSKIQNWNVASGEFISQRDVDELRRVAVIGHDLIEDFWDDPNFDPIGQIIRVNELPFEVIGVMEYRNSAFSGDNTAVFVPISVAQTRLANARVRGGFEVNTIYAQAYSEEVSDSAEQEIYTYFSYLRGTTDPAQEDFNITNQAELLEAIGQITAVLTIFLSIIASISLLVGGIGIMNIMLVTVTERTHEIGLRKAVGARPINILIQFLFESVLLSLIGGMLGVGFGWLIAVIGTVTVEQLSLSVDLDAVLLATIVSSIIGITFGILPANRAANMSPIDALRVE